HRRPQPEIQEGDDETAEEHALAAEEHHHAEAGVGQEGTPSLRPSLAVAVPRGRRGGAGRALPAGGVGGRRPPGGYADLGAGDGHGWAPAQFRTQMTITDSTMRSRKIPTSRKAVRRF